LFVSTPPPPTHVICSPTRFQCRTAPMSSIRGEDLLLDHLPTGRKRGFGSGL
jgi:hypothetical protein